MHKVAYVCFLNKIIIKFIGIEEEALTNQCGQQSVEYRADY